MISFCDNNNEDLIVKSPFQYIDGETCLVEESEVATMKFVGSKTEIPIPHIYTYANSASGNSVQWPHIIMSKAKGVQLDWDNVPLEGKEKVMVSLCFNSRNYLSTELALLFSMEMDFAVHVHYTAPLRRLRQAHFSHLMNTLLLNLCYFSQTQAPPTNSSGVPFDREIPHRENFYSIEAYLTADREYHDISIHGINDWDSPQNIVRYQHLHNELKEGLEMLVNSETGEFILAHPDLSLTNIFVDSTDYEVTCVETAFCRVLY